MEPAAATNRDRPASLDGRRCERHFFRAAGVDSRRLNPLEVAFVAPELTWAAMRGWLRYDTEARQLEVRGQLNWASLALFLCITFFNGWLAVVVLALSLGAYFAERGRFARVLRDAASAIVRGA